MLRGTFVRAIAATLTTLLAIGYVASTVELRQPASDGRVVRGDDAVEDLADGWRRTATGWQWRKAWRHPHTEKAEPPAFTKIHPATLAALQLLICLFALVWSEPAKSGTEQLRLKRLPASHIAARHQPNRAPHHVP